MTQADVAVINLRTSDKLKSYLENSQYLKMIWAVINMFQYDEYNVKYNIHASCLNKPDKDHVFYITGKFHRYIQPQTQ